MIVEAALREIRWVSEAVVFGDARPYLVAALTLDPDETAALAARLGVDADIPAMARDERVHAELAWEVQQANERFARVEQSVPSLVEPMRRIVAEAIYDDGQVVRELNPRKQRPLDATCDLLGGEVKQHHA